MFVIEKEKKPGVCRASKVLSDYAHHSHNHRAYNESK